MSETVIIGGSVAGVSAAFAMRDVGYQGTITIVEIDPRLPYERPPLSKAVGDAALRAIYPQAAYKEHDVKLLTGRRAMTLNPQQQTVHLDDGTVLSANRVLLSTGVTARTLTLPGGDHPQIHTLRDADDAARFTANLATGEALTVIGAGFIGLEAAAVARERGIAVTVIEAAEIPLSRALGDDCGRLVQQLHESHGVRFITGAELVGFMPLADGGVGTRLGDGTVVESASVLVGIGVRPNDELASALGIACSNGIVVDEFGRTSNPWVWAAGDVASYAHAKVGSMGRIEHWDVAMRHGAAVGRSMVGSRTVNEELPYFWSDQYGSTLRMFGRAGSDDRIVLRSGATPDAFVAFWLHDGRVSAVAGMNEAKTVRIGKSLIDSGAAFSDDELQLPESELRKLSRRSDGSLSQAS